MTAVRPATGPTRIARTLSPNPLAALRKSCSISSRFFPESADCGMRPLVNFPIVMTSQFPARIQRSGPRSARHPGSRVRRIWRIGLIDRIVLVGAPTPPGRPGFLGNCRSGCCCRGTQLSHETKKKPSWPRMKEFYIHGEQSALSVQSAKSVSPLVLDASRASCIGGDAWAVARN